MSSNLPKYPQEKRSPICLDEDTINEIAEKAAEKAFIMMEKKIYEEVGKSVISKFFITIGSVTIALWMLLNGEKIFK